MPIQPLSCNIAITRARNGGQETGSGTDFEVKRFLIPFLAPVENPYPNHVNMGNKRDWEPGSFSSSYSIRYLVLVPSLLCSTK